MLFYSLMNEVVHTSPTIGSNVEEVVWKNIHFLMWDIGGQETLRASWNTYYANSEVLLLFALIVGCVVVHSQCPESCHYCKIRVCLFIFFTCAITWGNIGDYYWGSSLPLCWCNLRDSPVHQKWTIIIKADLYSAIFNRSRLSALSRTKKLIDWH